MYKTMLALALLAVLSPVTRVQGPIVYLPSVAVVRPSPMRCAGDTYDRPDVRQAAGVQCWHDWSATPGGTGVPMLYGRFNGCPALSGDPLYVMGANEPDRPDQANVSPSDYVTYWAALEACYPGRRLVSPAVMDLGWLRRFWTAYTVQMGRAPRIDVVAVHWYYKGQGEPLDMFERQVLDAVALATEWQVPQVWMTEFALYPCWLGEQATVDFVGQAYSWMSRHAIITRAFWFQTYMTGLEPWAAGEQCNSSLGRADGMLTPVGQAFRASAAQGVPGDLTGDGCVDVLDLVVVGANFGQGCR